MMSTFLRKHAKKGAKLMRLSSHDPTKLDWLELEYDTGRRRKYLRGQPVQQQGSPDVIADSAGIQVQIPGNLPDKIILFIAAGHWPAIGFATSGSYDTYEYTATP
jgi:hypothetical protein